MDSKSQPSDLIARMIQLEELHMHEQRLVAELNGVLLRQQGQIDRLEERLRRLDEQWQQSLERLAEIRRPEEEKPPHY
jgi:SlyX protein